MSGNKRVFFDVEASGEKLGKIVMEVSEILELLLGKFGMAISNRIICKRLYFEGVSRAKCPIYCFLLAFWSLEAFLNNFYCDFLSKLIS